MQDNSYPQIIKLVFNYGMYSKPFVNHYKENDKDIEWSYFLKAMRCFWEGQREQALMIMETGILESDNEREKLLLNMNMMNILVQEHKVGWRTLFEEFKKEQRNLPPFLRETIMITLKNIGGLKKVKETRIWGNSYKKNLYAYAFILLGEAREALRSGDKQLAVAKFCHSFRVSREVPHPSGIIISSNNAAWYLRDINQSAAVNMSALSCYSMAEFFEADMFKFYVLHSYFQILQETGSNTIFRLREIISYIYPYMSDSVRKKYSDFIKHIEYLQTDIFKNSYDLDRETQKFLKKVTEDEKDNVLVNRAIKRIMNRNTDQINAKSVLKILGCCDLTVEENTPPAFVNEIYKKGLMIRFEESLKLLFEKNGKNIHRELVSFYSAYIGRSEFIQSVCRKGELLNLIKNTGSLDELISYIMGKTEKPRLQLIKFISEYKFINAIEKSRKDMFEKFLSFCKKEDKFIEKYCHLDEKGKGIVDEFIRNYCRYFKMTGCNVKPSERIYGFLKEYGLKARPAALSLYCIDNRISRKKMATTLNDMV